MGALVLQLFREVRAWAIVCALLFALGAGAATAAAQSSQPTVSEGDFWALIDDAHTALTDGDDVTAFADALEEIDAFTTANGDRIPIDTDYLVDQLRDEDVEPASLEAALEALLNARDEALLSIDADQAQTTLTDVLARSEFNFEEPPLGFWAQLRQWAGELFAEFTFRLLEAVGDTGSWFAWVLLGTAALALVAILVFWLRGVRRQFSAESNLEFTDQDDLELEANGALQRAETMAAAGDYRNAVRYMYLSALLLLDEQGQLRFDRSKTNREYLRSVAGNPSLRAALGSVVDVFDSVWYGFEPISAESYEQYAQQVLALRKTDAVTAVAGVGEAV